MLHEAHILLRTSGDGGEKWDAVSHTRSAIESHEQDRIRHDIDVIIDAARDLIEWLIAHDHPSAIALRHQWLEATPPLLRRLGVHALAEDPSLPADDAIELILKKQWLYERDVKHEVFRLLKVKYGNATEEARKRVLQASVIEESADEDEESQESIAYDQLNLVVWLHEAAPSCGLGCSGIIT